MKTNILRSAVVLLFLCAAVNVQALVVFSDNFENVPAVTWPDATQDADPFAQIGTWSVTETLQQDIQVSNNAVPGAASGTNFLSVFRTNATDVKATFAQSLNDTSKLVTVDFDLFFSNLCPTGEGANTALRTGTALNTLDVFMFTQNAGFRYVSNGVYLAPTQYFAHNQWHHVNITADMATDKYSVTIGAVTYANLALKTATDQLDYWWLSGNSVNSYFFLDNVVVASVPEPCTILILSIGGLLMKLRKKN